MKQHRDSKHDADRVKALLREAESLLEQEDLSAALDRLDEVLDLDEDSPIGLDLFYRAQRVCELQGTWAEHGAGAASENGLETSLEDVESLRDIEVAERVAAQAAAEQRQREVWEAAREAAAAEEQRKREVEEATAREAAAAAEQRKREVEEAAAREAAAAAEQRKREVEEAAACEAVAVAAERAQKLAEEKARREAEELARRERATEAERARREAEALQRIEAAEELARRKAVAAQRESEETVRRQARPLLGAEEEALLGTRKTESIHQAPVEIRQRVVPSEGERKPRRWIPLAVLLAVAVLGLLYYIAGEKRSLPAPFPPSSERMVGQPPPVEPSLPPGPTASSDVEHPTTSPDPEIRPDDSQSPVASLERDEDEALQIVEPPPPELTIERPDVPTSAEDDVASLGRAARPVFVSISGGEAAMGCVRGDSDCFEDELPSRHQLRPFELAVTEATNAQYAACVQAGRCVEPQSEDFARPDRVEHPVTGVSWYQAKDFCTWLGGRLPTESEWEYAARGGRSNRRYPWGFSISRAQANYGTELCCGPAAAAEDRWRSTAPVASFAPGEHQLYDMAGNVAEWTADAYPSEGEQLRVVKGGSWVQPPELLRVSARMGRPSRLRSGGIGVRCARDL